MGREILARIPMPDPHSETILVLDFGSQYTQLITRKVRELGVYSEIRPFNLSLAELKRLAPKGIILSGGPASVYEKDAPLPAKEIFETGCPVLGICYGLQIMVDFFGGHVMDASHREYGPAQLSVRNAHDLFNTIEPETQVWMSHGDRVEQLPEHFDVLACTANAPYAAVAWQERKLYGIQFHPEVSHTAQGKEILRNFAHKICGCTGNWTAENFIETAIAQIRKTVGGKEVICALSGGVDSSVAAALLYRAIGKQLHCVFVDTGLLRKNEAAEVTERFSRYFGDVFHAIPAAERFLAQLKGVADPEIKRKRIGNEFIHVFEEEAERFEKVDFLVQGTLYPDVIESVSPKGGPSVKIKTHHNVGGLPEKLKLELVEPLKELFKDEVRRIGQALGLPAEMLGRHPFPGP
jgi:GMP synthase (glutamine-hydrolysing)